MSDPGHSAASGSPVVARQASACVHQQSNYARLCQTFEIHLQLVKCDFPLHLIATDIMIKLVLLSLCFIASANAACRVIAIFASFVFLHCQAVTLPNCTLTQDWDSYCNCDETENVVRKTNNRGCAACKLPCACWNFCPHTHSRSGRQMRA